MNRAVIILWLTTGLLVVTRAQEPTAVAWDRQGTLHNRNSPFARLHTVPIRAVQMGPGFWAQRIDTNRRRSLPSLLEQLETHGVVDNFRRVSGRKKVERRGPLYTDSDLFKWMEAAALALQSGDDPAIRASLDSMIEEVAAAQEPGGYVNTYYSLERTAQRFTNLRHGHELYCMGHLIQAGIAHYRATGQKRLLDVGIRYADHILDQFGPGKKPAFDGHPESELALVELYRTTGDHRYLEFAGYLLDADRPDLKLNAGDTRYLFSGIPYTKRERLEGHSVRAMYANCGATDYYAESGDPRFRKTIATLWKDLVGGKMYLTAGVGSRENGEAIGNPYELPNEQAYTETCAALGNAFWNWRLLQVEADARYADLMERALYNGALSGVSLSGDLYFYRNPLESIGDHARRPWYDTTCCPPNIQRTLASLPGYLYGTDSRGVWVHFYHSSRLDWQLEDGRKLRLSQQTEYPWKGAVDLEVNPQTAGRFSLFLRIPGWTPLARILVNGVVHEAGPQPGRYLELTRQWKPGDRVRLEMQMPVVLTQANPRVREDFGRVAVERGPLVYSAESIDTPGAALFDLSLLLSGRTEKDFRVAFRPELLGGVAVIEALARVASRPSTDLPLYSKLGSRKEPAAKPAVLKLTMIPYYAWANRGPHPMQVWFPFEMRSGGR